MKVPGIASSEISRCMQHRVDGESVAVGKVLRKTTHHMDPLRVSELAGQGDQILAGHSGILTLLGGLCGVPKTGTVGRPAHVRAG